MTDEMIDRWADESVTSGDNIFRSDLNARIIVLATHFKQARALLKEAKEMAEYYAGVEYSNMVWTQSKARDFLAKLKYTL